MTIEPADARDPLPLGPPLPSVHRDLVDAILEGNCVAFVGAGFSAAASLPRWGELLECIASDTAQLTEEDRQRLHELVRAGTGNTLGQAAQLLEDRLDRHELVRVLSTLLASPAVTERMHRRLWYLKRIPFRAILTTNFDGLLHEKIPGADAYRAVLRPEKHRWWEETFWNEGDGPLVLKLHGDLLSDHADDIVLTRRDYRRRLYENTAYTTFLRATLATTTVLYLGFSFEDAYLNELRSEVLAMFRHAKGESPIAYAIANDVPSQAVEHFRAHEGIEIVPYSSADGFWEFDRYLEALYLATNPLPRFARMLGQRRILWIDRNERNNDPGVKFLGRAGLAGGLVMMADPREALDALEAAQQSRSPFDLVITHWGKPPDAGQSPVAVSVLGEMRRRDLRAPAVVFSWPTDVPARRSEAMRLGAYGYFFSFEELFQEIARIFAVPDG